jgi:hypothetical protein
MLTAVSGPASSLVTDPFPLRKVVIEAGLARGPDLSAETAIGAGYWSDPDLAFRGEAGKTH